jgi:adenosylmethionine-8-amino-7-oxononanoate aminotransferase
VNTERGQLFPANVLDRFPVIVRGVGCRVWDQAGRRYLDGIAGIAAVNVGYGRDEIAEAAARQLKALPYCAPNLFRNEPAMLLAAKLAELLPPGLNHVCYVSGGSEAVEVALKIARQYQVMRGKPGKHRVISRWTSYHGASMGALSVTGHLGRREKFLPMLFEVSHIPPAYCFRCSYGLTHPACNLRCARALEEAILIAGPDTVSAFIAEPIVGATAGCVVPPDQYLAVIREICDKYDVLLIADEVLTGFGRTGRTFAVDHWGVTPDLMVLAKSMSSGYCPLGAAIASDKIAAAFAQADGGFDHVFTYGGNPVATAVGLVALEILQREGLVDRARDLGAYLFRKAEMLREHPIVGDVRGKGLMLGIEFVRDRASMAPFDPELAVYQKVISGALDKGLILYPGHGAIDGVKGDHISIYPPLTISAAEIDEMIEILHATINEVESGLGYTAS